MKSSTIILTIIALSSSGTASLSSLMICRTRAVTFNLTLSDELGACTDRPVSWNSWIESSLMLRPTDSRPVCLGIKHPSGDYDQIFVTFWQLLVYWFGAFSLTRGRVCRLQLLLAHASAVILGSESRRTRGHILLSQIRDFPFRHLLRLAGSRWRYSTPPPHGLNSWMHECQAARIEVTMLNA
jgi:hypothetical protein